MVIPSAMFIEAAADSPLSAEETEKHVHELRSAIPQRANDDVIYGYLLGMQTARVLLLGMPSAVKAKVTL